MDSHALLFDWRLLISGMAFTTLNSVISSVIHSVVGFVKHCLNHGRIFIIRIYLILAVNVLIAQMTALTPQLQCGFDFAHFNSFS